MPAAALKFLIPQARRPEDSGLPGLCAPAPGSELL
jgi:hypothetical protein